jgi:aspartate aminotransferase
VGQPELDRNLPGPPISDVYAFVKVAGDNREVTSRWLEKGHVAAIPGSAFYAPGWVRLSYATSMEKLKEAMGRIKRVG